MYIDVILTMITFQSVKKCVSSNRNPNKHKASLTIFSFVSIISVSGINFLIYFGILQMIIQVINNKIVTVCPPKYNLSYMYYYVMLFLNNSPFYS